MKEKSTNFTVAYEASRRLPPVLMIAQLCQPAFSIGSINAMIPVFDQRAQVLVDKWNEALEASPTFSLDRNLSTELFGVTLDIIGLVGFGHNFEMTSSAESNRYADAFTRIMFGVRDLFIWVMAFRRWAPKLPIPPNWRREKNLDIFRSLLFPIIASKRAQAESRIKNNETDETQPKRKDLMDRLIEASLRDSENDARPLTDAELTAHVLTFAFAGHETTNTGMSWAIYALSFRSDIETKLRAEIEEVMGDREDITVQDVEKMEYMNCFVKEVLRLYPPAAITVRETMSDDVVSGVKLPKGTLVCIFPAVMHRLEQYWDKPDDFIPERWMDKAMNNNPAYIPFLRTPRIALISPAARLTSLNLFRGATFVYWTAPGHHGDENGARQVNSELQLQAAARLCTKKAKPSHYETHTRGTAGRDHQGVELTVCTSIRLAFAASRRAQKQLGQTFQHSNVTGYTLDMLIEGKDLLGDEETQN